jgi:uncharacterized cupredoxin-like copper-binding protein
MRIESWIAGWTKHRYRFAGAVVIGLALLASSGGLQAQESQTPDTTITIYSSGTALEFQPSRISAKAGTRVRIRLVNEGTLPHNVVLVRDDDDIDALGSAAYRAQDTGFVPLDQKDKLFAWTDLASPGETVEMTFDAPPPGEYFFVCFYPGHYGMMIGTLRVLN